MAFTNDVELTILDGGGIVTVPGANVQLLIAPATAGTVAQVVATRNPNTLISAFISGPLVQAGAMAIAAGALVLAMKATSATPGAASAVIFVGTGTSVITVSGAPVDTAYVKVKVIVGGTRGTTGITFQISYDAGRTYGPVYSLGTATTFVIPDLGVTLNFGAGTLVAGDIATFKCTEPLITTAGVLACLNAIQASQYGVAGWGSTHIAGAALAAGGWSGADANTINGYLNTLATGKIYTRAMLATKDVSPAAAYSGSGETEATWLGLLMADYASGASDAKRIDAVAGYYNMASPIPIAGHNPKFRRPLSYALAARIASGIPPQRHAGRVEDGALSQISIDAANDPTDGFVYHDERLNPGLDDARFTSAQTRIKKGGWWIKNPRLMAQAGSVFWLHPFGAVMDVACGIVTEKGQDVINDDVRLTDGGTLLETTAQTIESDLRNALKTNMVDAGMLSNATVVADRDWNVRDTFKVKTRVTLYGKGYILELDIEIGYSTSLSMINRSIST